MDIPYISVHFELTFSVLLIALLRIFEKTSTLRSVDICSLTYSLFAKAAASCEPLEKKLDKMVMRDLYGKFKTATTEEERERARKEYLDRRGVPESFRW